MVRDPKNNFREVKQMSDATVELKVDVEVLKNQVLTITQLCGKMDSVIEKLVDNHDRMVNQIYTDMEKRKQTLITISKNYILELPLSAEKLQIKLN